MHAAERDDRAQVFSSLGGDSAHFDAAMEALGLANPHAHDAHHETPGVAPGASLAEIKDAYRKLVQQYHPDRSGALRRPEGLIVCVTARRPTSRSPKASATCPNFACRTRLQVL